MAQKRPIDPQIKKLLELLDKATEEQRGSDRALYLLLKLNAEVLPELDYGFHKAFRQYDVTASGEMDMAIWHLLGSSKTFWEVFGKITGTDDEEPGEDG
mgnify:CR=1 FL=1